MTMTGGSINGQAMASGIATGLNAGIKIGANEFRVDSTTHHGKGRLAVQVSGDAGFSFSSWYYGSWHSHGYFTVGGTYASPAIFVTLPTQYANTRYYVRMYVNYDDGGNTSRLEGNYYTNRPPRAPGILAPANGDFLGTPATIDFSWTPNDPDAGLGPPFSVPSGYRLHFLTADGGDFTIADTSTTATSRSIGINYFPANSTVRWQVATYDHLGVAGPYSPIQTFSIGGANTPPRLLGPIDDQAVELDVAVDIRFDWQFLSPNQVWTQFDAQGQFRKVGDTAWSTLFTAAAANTFYDLFAPTTLLDQDTHYEWQVRTRATGGGAGYTEWSPSGFFWTSDVGSAAPVIIPSLTEDQSYLGVGNNRAFLYERGGKVPLGEITPMSSISWGRVRDDISTTLITTNGFGTDDGQLLSKVRSWRHEIVVFRDGKRVWEGPVVRVGFGAKNVVIEARDVMAYVLRRILRQGYNDAYRKVGGVQVGLPSVVIRARQIIMNALIYDDPNVLRYLTAIVNDDDARESRIVEAYSRTAWADVDDLAATAGLDYTTVGRRIILVDTHRGVGQIPAMTNGDFSDTPIVTEYGMQAANVFGVTNNSGIYGLADRLKRDSGGHIIIPPEGYVEQLALAYGETVGAVDSEVLTPAAKAELEATLRDQADRNVSGRWPPPLVVRVPDNTTLNPELNLGINQLVPGIWIPLNEVGTLRKASQLQKLDSMQVTQADGKAESITLVMSPAPLSGDDDTTTEEG